MDLNRLRPEIEADAEWLVSQLNSGFCLEVDDEVNKWRWGWFNAVFSLVAQHDDGSYFVTDTHDSTTDTPISGGLNE